MKVTNNRLNFDRIVAQKLVNIVTGEFVITDRFEAVDEVIYLNCFHFPSRINGLILLRFAEKVNEFGRAASQSRERADRLSILIHYGVKRQCHRTE